MDLKGRLLGNRYEIIWRVHGFYQWFEKRLRGRKRKTILYCGSIEQRKELLYGLMDTDGCVEDKNRFSFSTTSKKLAEDFIYLANAAVEK